MAADTPADIVWTKAGPRSRRFDDVYFSAEDGLAESRAVFLAGCGLPEAWIGRRRFVVGELGFGTGLNVAALLDLWARERPSGATLHVFSVEQFPLARESAARALEGWPELSVVTARMLDRWPVGQGFHRIDWPELGATLDLFHGEALTGLSQWRGEADAWFLDGFAPARNPEMWRPELLAAVAARSAPDARVATFTVAGVVQRGLQAVGFEVEKRPGFGRKRERLEALRSGAPATVAEAPSVAIIGGGIAGLSMARALAALGVTPTLISGGRPGASGNPAALVSPRFDVGDDPAARLHRQAFARATDLYTDVPEAVIARGLLQLAGRDRDGTRFARLAGMPAGRSALRAVSAQEAGEARDEPIAMPGLRVDDALTIEPAAIGRAWVQQAIRVSGEVARLERAEQRWRLWSDESGLLAEADAVLVCGGIETLQLRPELTLRPIRGQAAVADGVRPAQAVAWGGYAVPTRNGLLFGATHDRGDLDREVRAEDDQRNRETLSAILPGLAARLPQTLSGVAGIRAATPDHLPIAGELEPGLYVLTGFGGRGFTTAPLLAEHLAAEIIGAPSPLPADLAYAVRPR